MEFTFITEPVSIAEVILKKTRCGIKQRVAICFHGKGRMSLFPLNLQWKITEYILPYAYDTISLDSLQARPWDRRINHDFMKCCCIEHYGASVGDDYVARMNYFKHIDWICLYNFRHLVS